MPGNTASFASIAAALDWFSAQIPAFDRSRLARILVKCENEHWATWQYYNEFSIRWNGGFEVKTH